MIDECGDGTLNGDETCDDGNTRSGDGCSASCQIEQMNDECLDLDVMEVRKIVAPQPGDLVITEFLANPFDPESNREWFEAWVATDLDLNGLKILGTATPTQAEIDDAAPACSKMNCIEISAGSYVLFAGSDDPVVNGGLPTVACELPVTLSNLGDAIAIAHGDTLLHSTIWATPQDANVSRQLDPDFIDTMSTDADDNKWCPASPPTPKVENTDCP